MRPPMQKPVMPIFAAFTFGRLPRKSSAARMSCDDLRVVELLHQPDRLGQLVVADLVVGQAAVVDVGRERDVALGRRSGA